MLADKSVIKALTKILDQDPDNVPIRLQLATLLYEDGRYREALNESQTILANQPTNTDALILASQVAE